MRQIRNKSKNKSSLLIPTLCAIMVMVILFTLLAVYAAAEADSDKILRNVYVDSLRVGGLRTAEAAELLDGEFAQRTVTVKVGEGESREFTLEELGLMYKTDVIVGEAFAIGKSGSFGENVYAILSSFFHPKRLSSSRALVSSADRSALEEYLAGCFVAPTESRFSVEGDEVKVENGMNGREADVEMLLELIENAASYDEIREIDAPVNILPFVLPDVDGIYNSVAASPKAPYARNSEGAVTATVKVFNLDIAREIQREHSLEGERYEFAIDTQSVAVLESDVLYPDVIGEMTTVFDAGYVARAHNIRLAAALLDGAELLPGEEFSFNEHIGEITKAKGYKMAKGYSNGTVVDSVGAGVCQVSSTLYNAVLNANLQIVKRSSHSLPVAYLPLGQDAAISYPKQDFKFKNSSEHPVRITAIVDGGKLTVRLNGRTDPNFTSVEIINNTISVIEPKTVVVPDTSLPAGKRVSVSKGARGYVVESFRVVYKDGVEIKREALGKSTYKAQDKIINVGTEETTDEQDSQL